MKKPNSYTYPAVFTYEDGYEIAVTFPDLPGCMTCGKDDAEALGMAKEALGGHIHCLEIDGVALPAPTPLNSIEAEENERAVLVNVFMPVIRLANQNKSVNRTVTLPAWLNAVAVDKGVNFSQTLQTAIIEQLNLDLPSV